jgi:hypothetical protein
MVAVYSIFLRHHLRFVVMITRFHFDALLGNRQLSDLLRLFGGSKGHLEPLTIVVKHSSVRCDCVPWTTGS